MQLRRFRRLARRIWDEIPAHYREGAILMVHEEANPDPLNPGVHLFGMCEPAFAALEDAFAASGDVRSGERQSLLHIWYGSFLATDEMARRFRPRTSSEMLGRNFVSPGFDWKGELEETILHELTHHWEQRAGLDGLDRFDAAQLINFRRLRGHEVPFGFWRDGEPAGPDRWRIDGDLFVEVPGEPPWTVKDGAGRPVTCEPDPLDGWATVFERGAELDGVRGDLVVAPRPPERRTLWGRVKAWFGGAE